MAQVDVGIPASLDMSALIRLLPAMALRLAAQMAALRFARFTPFPIPDVRHIST